VIIGMLFGAIAKTHAAARQPPTNAPTLPPLAQSSTRSGGPEPFDAACRICGRATSG
jgi:hypothetical protein